jgi:hypothetical protein
MSDQLLCVANVLNTYVQQFNYTQLVQAVFSREASIEFLNNLEPQFLSLEVCLMSV